LTCGGIALQCGTPSHFGEEPKYQCTFVSEHIRNCAANIHPNFSVFPINKFYKATTEKERKTKEKLFIEKYKPSMNATQNSYNFLCYNV
jgi:hypothetical protein